MRTWVSIVLVALAGLVVLACGGDTSDGPPFGSGGTGGVTLSCETLTDPPPDCDKTCTSDTQCEASFCDSGVCVANCTPTEGCGENWSCNVRGRCIANISTGGTGGTGNTDCQSVTITPTRSIPNVMFLVDQSGSMVANFGGGEDRWEAANTVITFDYLSVIYVAIVGYLLFAEIPTWHVVLGAMLLIASGLYVVFDEARQQRRLAGELGE